MPNHWALRWFVMLIVFALSTSALSSYANADSSATEPADASDLDFHHSAQGGEQRQEGEDTGDGDADDRQGDSTAGETSSERQASNIEHSYDPTTTNYMLTITRSAFLGALLGAMIGASFYLISQFEISPWTIAYFTAGGVFVGATVGLVEISVRESRINRDRQPRSEGRTRHAPDRPTPGRAQPQGSMPTRITVPVIQFSF